MACVLAFVFLHTNLYLRFRVSLERSFGSRHSSSSASAVLSSCFVPRRLSQSNLAPQFVPQVVGLRWRHLARAVINLKQIIKSFVSEVKALTAPEMKIFCETHLGASWRTLILGLCCVLEMRTRGQECGQKDVRPESSLKFKPEHLDCPLYVGCRTANKPLSMMKLYDWQLSPACNWSGRRMGRFSILWLRCSVATA